MRFSQATLLAATALMGLVNAAPTSIAKRAPVIIGYRVTNKEEGKKLKENGMSYDRDEEGMLGLGMSLSYDPAGYEPQDSDDAMWVVVRQEQAQFDKLGKCWIPQYTDKIPNWWDDGSAQDYVENQKLDAVKTLRLAPLVEPDDGVDTVEIFIPKDLANDKSQGFTVEVFESADDLPDEPVDYNAWKPKGTRETPEDQMPDEDEQEDIAEDQEDAMDVDDDGVMDDIDTNIDD